MEEQYEHLQSFPILYNTKHLSQHAETQYRPLEGFFVVVALVGRQPLAQPRNQIRMNLYDVFAVKSADDRKLNPSNNKTRR